VHPPTHTPALYQVLTEEVDRKYANRVVTDVGLAICLYDFVEVGDAYLYPSDGAAHHRGAFLRASCPAYSI
jgi:DNA-directed RNA polymerase subunit E'/Rpb7